jgi:hypothetical protein
MLTFFGDSRRTHSKFTLLTVSPGQYFRVMMIGFFEGLDSERGVAWRLADSLTLRQFLSIGLDENTPDHVTISRGAQCFQWYLLQLSHLYSSSSQGEPRAVPANAISRQDLDEGVCQKPCQVQAQLDADFAPAHDSGVYEDVNEYSSLASPSSISRIGRADCQMHLPSHPIPLNPQLDWP